MASQTVRRKEVIVAHKCAVATDDERCSKIALDVLRGPPLYPERGNAIDAAVAAALALGVVSMASSGLGGGAFMVLRLANGKAEVMDMRETAPIKASEDMYQGNPSQKANGPLSIAVPGELDGLYRVWQKHGTLPWASLVEPAEKLARGFEISDYLYSEMCLMEPAIRDDKGGLSDLFIRNDKLLKPGYICRNIKLAETLKLIAKDGSKTFYHGKVGDDLIKDIETIGGIITKVDLKAYKAKTREPIIANISGLQFISMPPPSAGGAGIVLMLNILAQYGIPINVSGDLGIHREIEALKHLFAVRLNIGDPDFVDVKEVISDMLSVEFAKELKASIDDNKTFDDPEHYGGKWNELHDYNLHEHGTSHLSVVDHHGNGVALTASINYHFGAQILSQRTGILFNNQMDDFSIPSSYEETPNLRTPYVMIPNLRTPNIRTANLRTPYIRTPRFSTGIGEHENQPANFIRPGKRPLSSMSPTIILKNGKLKAVVGASGGTLIIPGVLEVFLNHFAKGLDQLPSVIAPRVYHQLIPNKVHYENFTTVTGDHIEVPLETRKSLIKKGHVLEKLDSGSAVQFITLKELLMGNEGGKIVAVSDPRKGGVPAGY